MSALKDPALHRDAGDELGGACAANPRPRCSSAGDEIKQSDPQPAVPAPDQVDDRRHRALSTVVRRTPDVLITPRGCT